MVRLSEDQSGELGLRRPRVVLGAAVWRALGLGAEILVILACAVGCGIVYHQIAYGDVGIVSSFLSVGVLMSLIYTTMRVATGAMKARHEGAHTWPLRAVMPSWNVAFSALLLAALISKQTLYYSRGTLLLTYVCGLIALTLVRSRLDDLELKSIRNGRVKPERLLIVGLSSAIASYQARWRSTLDNTARAETVHLPIYPARALDEALQNAVAQAKQREVSDILLLVPWSQPKLIKRCVSAFMTLPVRIQMGLDPALESFHSASVTHDLGTPTLKFADPPLHGFEIVVKRGLDVCIAAVAIVLLAPLLAAIALAIKLDSRGPVLFLQRRSGFNDNTFTIYKFRSMTTLEDGEVVKQAVRNDPRVTRVGRWLRRLNLDELPQLFNVLRGDMSIVGPRPHAVAHGREFERIVAQYARRHAVKPGITGWAQIHGLRGETDTYEKIAARVDYDLFYIDNWSLTLDLYIILATMLPTRGLRNSY